MVMQHLGPLMFYMSKGKKGDAACRAVAEKLDILGLNYAASRYEEDCLTYPNRIMVGSETIIGELPTTGNRSRNTLRLLVTLHGPLLTISVRPASGR